MSDSSTGRVEEMERRRLLLLGLAAPAAAGAGWAARELELGALREVNTKLDSELALLRQRLDRLPQRWVASGGGTNLKLMPDESGRNTVELLEVFSFDRHHAYCRVDTNPKAFVMPTDAMGSVVIPANGFFMAMAATAFDQFAVRQVGESKATATLTGRLDCHTEVLTASIAVGSRTVAEPASFEIEAVDGGVGGGKAGDSFAFTVLFDERTAPVNHRIFGRRFTFTGQMIEGEITIQNLARLAAP